MSDIDAESGEVKGEDGLLRFWWVRPRPAGACTCRVLVSPKTDIVIRTRNADIEPLHSKSAIVVRDIDCIAKRVVEYVRSRRLG